MDAYDFTAWVFYDQVENEEQEKRERERKRGH